MASAVKKRSQLDGEGLSGKQSRGNFSEFLSELYYWRLIKPRCEENKAQKILQNKGVL